MRGKQRVPLDDLEEVLQTSYKREMPQPTDAVPGTEEKIEVLRKRVAAGEELWHPLDGLGGKKVVKARGPDLRLVRGKVKEER